MPHRHVLAVLTIVALSSIVVACGNDGPGSATSAPSSEAPITEAPITEAPATESPATSPDEATAPESTSPEELPTEESASALLVGKSEDDAQAAADDAGWGFRVARRDGEDLALTMDLREDRVNVEITDDVVSAIVSIG